MGIRLDGVSICYRLAKQRIGSFKQYVISWATGALVYEELWALDGIDLEISPGESVGVVGRNGAGKSTLLKVISGVLSPTRGSVRVDGRVVPLLELGTGFDYELTGAENVYLNALLLGHGRRDIRRRFDDIVDFSELGDFIHSPIRSYSTGMVARLGFAIATAWETEILILDEVLSVGDAAFRDKCQERLDAFHAAGTTMILVSHDETSVERLCERAVLLAGGRLIADGPAAETLAIYSARAADTAVAAQ